MESFQPRLTMQEAFSGIFGSISMATWIFLLLPQLMLNYKTRNADGISLAFLGVWMIGDVANLLGALWASLVPTVVALAIYFCIADIMLISQCLYYNHINASVTPASHIVAPPTDSDTAPLLIENRRRSTSSSSLGLPGSHRRRSSALSRQDSLIQIFEEDSVNNPWLQNTLSILGVILVGTLGWLIAYSLNIWIPTPIDPPSSPLPSPPGNSFTTTSGSPIGAEVLGYASATCYLGARIPQIIKNYRDKSCEGLALLFFLLSLMGNATYGASIICHSLERDYLNTNLPWLIGSLGTIAEDGIIFGQFKIYSKRWRRVPDLKDGLTRTDPEAVE